MARQGRWCQPLPSLRSSSVRSGLAPTNPDTWMFRSYTVRIGHPLYDERNLHVQPGRRSQVRRAYQPVAPDHPQGRAGGGTLARSLTRTLLSLFNVLPLFLPGQHSCNDSTERTHAVVIARLRKCVAPIHCLSVPKGCSTVRFRTRIISGALRNRFCISSSTASCSQRRTRRSVLGVHCDFKAQPWHFELQ